MSVKEFYKSTERELYNFITAKVAAEKEQRTHDWDVARHIMWSNVQPHSEKQIKVRDLIRLESDSDRKELSGWENQELKKWNKLMDEGPKVFIPK